MPVSEDQLRQLLAERSEPARDRPVPQERITAHVRRARIRRAAGAGLLAVAVAAGVVTGVNLAHEDAPGHPASYSGAPLPASFTAPDGAAYHRLALISLAEPAQQSATLTVHVGSEPVDVMGTCDAPGSGAAIAVKVNGTFAGFIECQGSPRGIGVSVPPGHWADITLLPGSAFGLPAATANWRLATYTWTPPATARAAPAVPHLRRSYTGPDTTTGHGNAPRRLIASRSGDWPADRTATFTLTYRGRNLDVSIACAGFTGDRLLVSLSVNGRGSETAPCTSWRPEDQAKNGYTLNRQNTLNGQDGGLIKLTFRIEAPSPYAAAAYAKRAASWTIAVYEEQT
jgi:hypothetical protein